MSKKKIVYLTELSILVAIVLLMSFTPLGYLKMPGIEITFITIPVIIGAVVMGPLAGGILGAAFGITSFIQCFGMSAFGVMLLGINPVFTAILCVIPRIIMGVLTGYIFKAFKKKNIISFIVPSVSGALLNTIMFVGGIILFFGGSTEIMELITTMGAGNVLAFAIAFVGINGLIEAGACAVLGTAVSKVLYTVNTKKIL